MLEPLLPQAQEGGRPREYSYREILNGIFYITRGGCSWRMMPHDLPHWKTVYHYFRLWRKDGTLERLHHRLRERVRLKMGREAQPSAAILDSQSVKTGEKGGSEATTEPRRSRAASVTCWWTHKGWCSR